MTTPSIDHSFLSPSGHISKQARATYIKRLSIELFGQDGLQSTKPTQPSERETLLRNAAMWRDLASRGMSIRKFIKQAEAAEAKASTIY